jgi:heme/copper-type cytochrome/quinol oxidase subunit 1
LEVAASVTGMFALMLYLSPSSFSKRKENEDVVKTFFLVFLSAALLFLVMELEMTSCFPVN